MKWRGYYICKQISTSCDATFKFIYAMLNNVYGESDKWTISL